MKDIVLEFNKLGFLLSELINLCDNLEGTNVYSKQLKFHLNRAREEAIKLSNRHFKAFNEGEMLTQSDGKEISPKDIYNITSKAYEFLLQKNPNEIVVIAQIIQDKEKQGLNYYNVDIPYKKLE